MRASILDYAEVVELLEPHEDEVSISIFKNKLIDPTHHIFLSDDILFCMFFIGMGLYDMHIYTRNNVKLKYLRDFCMDAARSVKVSNPDMVGAINIVKKDNRALRLMMHRLFKSERLKTFENGDTMFFTDISITREEG